MEEMLDSSPLVTSNEDDIDPIYDIIDYLVRCVNISLRSSNNSCNAEIRTSEKIKIAYDMYIQSPTRFLLQFGKYLLPTHVQYFEAQINVNNQEFQDCISELKEFHSHDNSIKRIRNRRYKAMQKMKEDTDYFSEKQMMYRNPLLYEQLVGQYLTDEEIQERDAVDNDNLTFLSMILETVDRNEMREIKNKQKLVEDLDSIAEQERSGIGDNNTCKKEKQWGDFDEVDTKPDYKPEKRAQAMLNANERNLLREEFLQEMYSSFIEGRDVDFDYANVDNNEEYDDLQQISQDAEDKYFDSEDNDAETLEQHMLVQEYGKKAPNISSSNVDPLDEFMQHISNKI